MKNTVEWASDPGYYGGDETHALKAWASTRRELTPEKRKRIPTFLADLSKAGHHTPFEASMLHFLVTCETASHIHHLKHRIGVSINAESARYKELKDDKFYVPEDWPEEWQRVLSAHMDLSYSLYHRLVEELTPKLGRKRAKESSRFVLPYANQLTLDVSFNFRSFMHFQKLRNSSDAQKEIADIAEKMLDLVWETGKFDNSLKAWGW